MARLNINIGTTANDKTGDPLRTAFNKVNQNFIELYNLASADVQIPAQTGNNGKYLTTNGTTLSWSNVSTTGQWAFNGDTAYNNTGNPLYIQPNQGTGDGGIYLPADESGDDVTIVNNAGGGIGLSAGNKSWQFNNDGTLELPAGGDIVDSVGNSVIDPTRITNGGGILSINGSFIQIMPPGNQNIIIQPGNISSPITLRGKFLTIVEYNSTWDSAEDPPLAAGLNTNSTISLNQNGISFSNTRSGTASDFEQVWMFDNDGNLQLPQGGDILDSAGNSVLGGSSNLSTEVTVTSGSTAVIYSCNNYQNALKLILCAEGHIDSDVTFTDHTQVAEATIAATYNTNTEPVMSVYGLVYTSPNPLATFSVQRNGSTIEVLATNNQGSQPLYVRVHAIPFVSHFD